MGTRSRDETVPDERTPIAAPKPLKPQRQNRPLRSAAIKAIFVVTEHQARKEKPQLPRAFFLKYS